MFPLSDLTIDQLKSRIKLTVTLLLITVIFILSWHINTERKDIMSAAHLQAQGYARALSEHAGSSFAEADCALREVVNEISLKGGIGGIEQHRLFEITGRLRSDMPQIADLFLANRSGTMIINSTEFPPKPINISDREYFIHARNNADSGLLISNSLINLPADRRQFIMMRPFANDKGSFAGLAAVEFKTSFFNQFYSSINIGKRSHIFLIRTDGSPLVCEPFTNETFSTDFSKSPLFQENLKKAGSGTFFDNTGAHGAHIVSYQKLSRFPIIAVVSLHSDDFLNMWKRKALFDLSMSLGLCLTITLLALLLFHHLEKLQKTQNSLREQQEMGRLKAAQVDAAKDAILLVQNDGRLIQFNNAFCEMTGYAQEELEGSLLRDFQPPETLDRQESVLLMLQEKGEAVYETAFIHKMGHHVPVEVHSRLMPSESSAQILGIYRDISERKQSELREQTRLLILEEIATGVRLQDILNHIVHFVEQEHTNSLCSILLADENGTHLFNGAAPSLPDFYNEAVNNGIPIAEGVGSCGTAAHRRKRVIVEDIEGHPFWEGVEVVHKAGLRSCWSEPILSSQGELLGTFAIYNREPCIPHDREIRLLESAAHLAGIAIERFNAEKEKIRLEEQLNHVQKIEAIGQLAGGIAHDFNNLLTPIIGYAEIINTKAQDDDSLQNRTKGIIAAACKARDLTQQLLSFGRKQMLVMKPVDLNSILSGFQDILRRTIRENIAIEVHLAPGRLAIKADSGQIEQILLNLAVNAQDAITGNGVISIETGHVVLDNEYVRLHPGMQPGPYALLAFSDNGRGMENTILSHIFEPFFTTKQVGHGTGLGLATVYGIIKQHEGSVTVNSRPGAGTTFNIYLPLTEELFTVAAEKPASRETQVTAPSGSVLVVEDNEMVLDMVVELLSGSGYHVLPANRPSMAMEVARQHAADIRFLISDVIMPEMSGQDLYEKLLQILPHLKVLYISGYNNELFSRNGTLEEEVNFLQKPFTTERLLERIRLMARE